VVVFKVVANMVIKKQPRAVIVPNTALAASAILGNKPTHFVIILGKTKPHENSSNNTGMNMM